MCAHDTAPIPQELAESLTGLPFEAVSEDGAPFGCKAFVFWDPPTEDERKNTRCGAGSEATLLFNELLRQQVSTMTFVRTRRQAELAYRYTLDLIRQYEPEMAKLIAPYRGTYLPEDRRRIERDLFMDKLRGVVATNALELGVDIGRLDATVIAGVPRHHRQHVAAGGTQWAQRGHVALRPCRPQRPAGPVPHAPPGVLLRQVCRGHARCSGEPVHQFISCGIA